LGRYLNWLGYFGEDWLQSHIESIFPDGDGALRRAAWLGHLLNDSGPATTLVQPLLRSYFEEISNLGKNIGLREQENRENRLGDYLFILFMAEVLPNGVMEEFWSLAPARARAHVVGFLGRELRLPPDKLSAEWRARAHKYWDLRLSEAMASDRSEGYRQEIMAMGQWFIPSGIESAWLLEQLLRVTEAGFAPTNGYVIIKWLGEVAASEPDKAVTVLSRLVNNPSVDQWTFTMESSSLRAVLEEGQQTGNSETMDRVCEIANYLATIGQTGYLDLAMPLVKTG
jgi:hypothetical protein